MKRYMTLIFAISYFLISIILVFLDYFNVFSTLGFRMGNINWDFTGMVITNVIVVLLFVITYETLDKRSAEKENNKRLIPVVPFFANRMSPFLGAIRAYNSL